jgi:hypothetical protein
MHGDHAVEYLMYKKNEPDPFKQHLTGIDRVYRAESLLLNMIWRGENYYSKVKADTLWLFLTALFKTGLKPDELNALAKFLTDPDLRTGVLEVPLSEFDNGRDRLGRPVKSLLVNEERAAAIYKEFAAKVEDKSLFKSAFHVEIMNGTDIPRLGTRVRQYITGYDISVLSVDNYEPKPLLNTYVIDRSGNTVYSARLLHMTALDRDRLYISRNPSDVDTTILLGNDFNIRKLRL